jgi:hypothetical protein
MMPGSSMGRYAEGFCRADGKRMPHHQYQLSDECSGTPDTPCRVHPGDRAQFYGYEKGAMAVDTFYVVRQAPRNDLAGADGSSATSHSSTTEVQTTDDLEYQESVSR